MRSAAGIYPTFYIFLNSFWVLEIEQALFLRLNDLVVINPNIVKNAVPPCKWRLLQDKLRLPIGRLLTSPPAFLGLHIT